MSDLATVGINVVLQGQQQAIAGLNQVAAAADNKVSPAAKRVIENFRQTQQMMGRVATQAQVVNRAFTSLEISRVAQRMGSLENVLNNTRQGMNGFGVITQQAGYQIGDFIVQVQSGTSAFVAFGQQATQMVGFLPLLAAELGIAKVSFMGLSMSMASVTLGLSIIIPLITAVGAAWMRTSEENSKAAKKQKDAYDQLRESLEEYVKAKEAAAKGITVDQDTAVNKLKEASDKLIASKRDLQIAQAGANIGAARGSAGLATGAYLASLFTVKDAQDDVNLSVEEELKVRQDIARLRDQMLEKYSKESEELAFSGQLEAAKIKYGQDSLKYKQLQAQEDRKSYEDGLRSLDINEGYIKALLFQYDLIVKNRQELEAAAIVEERRKEALELYNENLKEQTDLIKDRDADVKKIIKSRDDELAALQQQKGLYETILKFGKDSQEVKAKEAEIAREVYMQEQIRNGILGNNLTKVMEAYDAMAKVKSEVDLAATGAKTFADNLKEAVSAMQSLLGLGSNIERALAVANAKVTALKTNADAATAGTVAGYRFDLAEKRNAAISAGVDPGFVNPIAARQGQTLDALEKALAEEAALRESSKSGRKTKKQDPLEKLKEQLALENELIGKTEAQQRVFKALGEDRSKYSKKEIDAITAEIDAYNVKMETIKKQEDLMNKAKSALEDGFMAMVDGTMSVKDAFKSMARDIIKELYRVLVVQRMVNSIADVVNGFMTPTPSPSFLGGRASGGSVMGGGAYLVGENGPELVVPRHSGTVMNANQTANALGGGSGNVTVQNNITVTGSDAAMVRAEVAKMIPQITNATKAAVIDAKQRGGQMAAAFR